MAFTRAFLSGLGIDKEKIDAVMEAHVEVTDSLKRQRDEYKETADKYQDVKKELDGLKTDGWKEKHDKLKAEYDKYKAERENADIAEKKSGAYRAALKSAGIGDKWLDTVMNVAKLDDIELDADGNLKDADKIAEGIKDKFGGFISEQRAVGQDVKKPKTNTGGTMTRDQIMAITDRAERREAIRNNPQAFGYGKE